MLSLLLLSLSANQSHAFLTNDMHKQFVMTIKPLNFVMQMDTDYI